MPDLPIPPLTVTFDAVPSGAALLEKPIDVRCAPVTFPDGSVFDQSRLGAAGFFAYRQSAPGAPLHVWDESTKEWKPDTGTPIPRAEPKPFAFKLGEPLPWQALLIAVGQKDKAGQNQFAPAVNDYPQYSLRAYFSGAVEGVSMAGLSAPSAPVRFVKTADTMLAGLEVGEGEEPNDATTIQMFLRFPEKQNIGLVQMTRAGGTAQVEIMGLHPDGTPNAVIRLLPSGDIALHPAQGRQVVIYGPLETEQILYRPSGGGAKQWLV
jgi:hypothetical protein